MSRLPFSPGLPSINRLHDEMDRAFGRVFGEVPGLRARDVFPPVNVWEDDNNLFVEAELPGLGMEDLEILVKDRELVLNGERKAVEDANQAFHRRERGVGKFSRTLNLPYAIDAEKVEASLKEGVLHLTLPKAEAAKPRKIEVKCS